MQIAEKQMTDRNIAVASNNKNSNYMNCHSELSPCTVVRVWSQLRGSVLMVVDTCASS